MHRFSLEAYRDLLLAFERAGYSFRQFEEINHCLQERETFIVLRHDIDISLRTALEMAHVEYELGVQATYFVTFHSPFYNLLSQSNADSLLQINQWGHQIALHLDCIANEEQCTRALEEIGVLAKFYPYINPQLASLHSPSNLELFPLESFRQLRDVYGPILSKDMMYISDSTGRWRYGHPLDSEAFSSRRPIQLLIHPIWWLQDGEMPSEKLGRWLYKDYLNTLATANKFLPKLFGDYISQQRIRNTINNGRQDNTGSEHQEEMVIYDDSSNPEDSHSLLVYGISSAEEEEQCPRHATSHGNGAASVGSLKRDPPGLPMENMRPVIGNKATPTPISMKGNDAMSETPQFSEAKRVLLEKYLRGDHPQAASAISQDANGEMTGRRECAIAVQAEGSRRPFFYLHGEWRGSAFYCYPLAQALGSDQPFYILEPYTFEGLRVPPPLERIAEAHLEALRRIQPEGPYLLGGWCNGALVAYEMARQLHAQGQAVDLLVLMDSMVPGHRRWIRSVISRLGGLLRLGQEKQLDWFLIVHHVYRYLRFPRYRQRTNSGPTGDTEQGERGYSPGKRSFGLPRLGGLFMTAEALRKDYPKVFEWVAAGCAPDLYPGKITFFWTSENPGYSVEWQEVVKAKEGEVEIHNIPGNDLTSRIEYLPVLAEHLRTCLSKVQITAMS